MADWEWRLVVREFIREAGTVRGIYLLNEACADTASIYRHRVTGERQLRPHHCQNRSICPTCAVAYGKGRGDEVESLIKTLFSGGVLVRSAPSVKAFAQVYTFPGFVSDHLDSLVQSRDQRALRRCLRDLTAALRDTLVHWFGPGVGAKVAWHWWHSSAPITGPYWHAHVMIPNLDVRDGECRGILRAKGMFSREGLAALAAAWSSAVQKLPWVVQLGEIPAQLVVNHRFLRSPAQVAHRCRYDYRHPMQDFVDKSREDGLPDPSDPRVAWFLDRCELLQGVKLVRGVGWLSNAKAKRLGIRREETIPDDDWVKCAGWVEFERFDLAGVHVRTWEDGWPRREFWARDSVDLRPRVSSRGYRWKDPGT